MNENINHGPGYGVNLDAPGVSTSGTPDPAWPRRPVCEAKCDRCKQPKATELVTHRQHRASMTRMPNLATSTSRGRQTVIVLLTVIAAILLGWALKMTYVVTMPLTLAFFVALVLRPLQRRLNTGLPRSLRWSSVVVCMTLFLAVLGGLLTSTWLSLRGCLQNYGTRHLGRRRCSECSRIRIYAALAALRQHPTCLRSLRFVDTL